MDSVEEEHQARRVEERAQQDLPNITPAPVLNKDEDEDEDDNQNST